MIGQLLGGALISADLAGTHWRAIFLINVPIGIAGLADLEVGVFGDEPAGSRRVHRRSAPPGQPGPALR